ncbi:hypothetical protein Z517_09068 [Fonsecaea pedrosoi CBS 271.37]|uniref:Uncharacterized protein n=1 Tax=Fonsecaea pedrosoi CBS 271.37 TaxID=1442368 RepID=A0A0D2GW94_9EURO|nr:uncharacterized protein Z517_09068 [Fonsecaea pedrosoi CBS 271.37]KIW76624.1 hypothetical protein Z517_09068 [Fonsecaea pedrosoi CBS 271.37]
MPSPAQPILPSPSTVVFGAAPTHTHGYSQPLNTNDGRHSPGAIVGISICAIVCFAWIARYSYLASPFWLQHMRRCLGMRPASRTPISHLPLPSHGHYHRYYSSDDDSLSMGADELPTQHPSSSVGAGVITRPQRVYLRPNSKDTLPLYEPTNQFSSDVLEGLFDLGPTPGSSRAPSYRSKLSQEWMSAMGTMTRNNRTDEEPGRVVFRVREV